MCWTVIQVDHLGLFQDGMRVAAAKSKIIHTYASKRDVVWERDGTSTNLDLQSTEVNCLVLAHTFSQESPLVACYILLGLGVSNVGLPGMSPVSKIMMAFIKPDKPAAVSECPMLLFI